MYELNRYDEEKVLTSVGSMRLILGLDTPYGIDNIDYSWSDINLYIESIELNINDNLIMYLSKVGEPNSDGVGSPFSVISKRMLRINPVNIKICI